MRSRRAFQSKQFNSLNSKQTQYEQNVDKANRSILPLTEVINFT